MVEVSVVGETPSCALGEGALWDEKLNVLLWIDILGGKLFVYNPRLHRNREVDMGQMIGTVVASDAGGVVAALEDGFYHVDLETEDITHVAGPPNGANPECRFNDGKCDPAGRFWAGTMGRKGKGTEFPKGIGKVYTLNNDATVTTRVSDVTIPNGIVWMGDTMYHIDSADGTIYGWDYNGETGEVQNRRAVISYSKDQGAPDGMCADINGMLYVASFGGACVHVWNPQTGKVMNTIPIPAKNVTSCAFGGNDMSDLYVTTANVGMTPDELKEYPLAGKLFVVRGLGVKGAPVHRYKGPIANPERRDGRVVVVTGGAKGIGRGICESFLTDGVSAIACVDVDESAGKVMEARDPRVRFYKLDISDPDAVESFYNTLQKQYGRLDCVVNNAGIQPPSSCVPADQLPDGTWEALLRVNLNGTFFMSKYAIPALRSSPGKSRSIINIASVQGLQSQHNVPGYAASKGAVLSLTRQMAVQYAAEGIRVLSVCPGTIKTPLVDSLNQAADFDYARTADRYPIKRVGEPSDIGHAVVFLASQEASFITGDALSVDGGIMAWGSWAGQP